MDEDSNMGMNRLARAIQDRMNRNRDANSELVLDFGTIQSDRSLKTNTFAHAIPRADYHVARHLTLGGTGSVLSYTTQVDGHSHAVTIPQKMRSVQPGDRVLVAWVQSEPVIVDVIVRGNSV